MARRKPERSLPPWVLVKKLKKNKVYNFTVTALFNNTDIGTSPVVYSIAGKAFKGKTEAKKVTVKKRKLTVKVNKAKKIKKVNVKAKGGKLLKYAKKVRYISADPAIATVTAKGKVKGLAAGTTKIWLLAVNGVRKAVKVTVK